MSMCLNIISVEVEYTNFWRLWLWCNVRKLALCSRAQVLNYTCYDSGFLRENTMLHGTVGNLSRRVVTYHQLSRHTSGINFGVDILRRSIYVILTRANIFLALNECIWQSNLTYTRTLIKINRLARFISNVVIMLLCHVLWILYIAGSIKLCTNTLCHSYTTYKKEWIPL